MNMPVIEKPQTLDLSPKTFDEAWRFCEIVTNSGLAPKGFEKKPNDAFIAIQWGAEVGLKPLQALQNIAVINGRPSLWGDAVIAIVRSSPLCEYVKESDDGHTATCIVKRKNNPEEVRTFSMDDAKAANLMGKQGSWTNYPKRMRQMRARGFAVRDVFPDVLKGIPVAEELMDYEEKEINPSKPVEPVRPEIEAYPAQAFSENFPKWEKLIVSGKKTAEAIISMVSSKAQLTEEQANLIRSVAAPIEGEAEVVQ
jgi:hypothetical protein